MSFSSDIEGDLSLRDIIRRAENGEYFEIRNRFNGCYFWKERCSCWNSMSNIEWLGRKLFCFIPGIYSVRDISICRTFQNISQLYRKTSSEPYRVLRYAIHRGNQPDLAILNSISEVKSLIETDFSFSKLEKLPSELLTEIAEFLPEQHYSPCPLRPISKMLQDDTQLRQAEASRLAAISNEELEQQLNNLLRNYYISIETTVGCGFRGQYYVDNAWASLQSFVKKYPAFSTEIPQRKHKVSDDSVSGFAMGLAMGLSRLY